MKRHRAACAGLPRVYSLTMDKPVRHAQSSAMIAWELAVYLAHQPREITIWSTPDLQTMWYSPAMVEKARWAIEQVAPLREEMAAEMTPIADVAIGHSRQDILLSMSGAPSITAATTSPAHRLLSEAQIPFNYVDLDRPLKMGDTHTGTAPVLMLNAIGKLPAAQIREILSWVKKGGNLIVTGRGEVTDVLPDLKLGHQLLPRRRGQAPKR